MITVEIFVDENVFRDAEKVLHSIGMDVQIAVNVFLRRVAIEKGLPMSMSAAAYSPKKMTILPMMMFRFPKNLFPRSVLVLE